MIIPIKLKSEVPIKLVELIKSKQNSTRKVLSRLHTDGGGEFINNYLKSFLSNQGTRLTHSPPYTPQLNGLVERMNRTITTMVRCMLVHSNAPLQLGYHAYLYAAYIHNHMCQNSNGGNVPIKLMNPDHEFNLNKIHVFGSDAHALIEEGPTKHSKLKPRTEPAIYIGYNQQNDSHKLLLLNSLSVTTNYNVTFSPMESEFTHMKLLKDQLQQQSIELKSVDDAHESEQEWEVDRITDEKLENGLVKYLVYWTGYDDPTWVSSDKLTNCKEKLMEYENVRTTFMEQVNAIKSQPVVNSSLDYYTPQTYKEAQRHSDWPQWSIAVDDECISMEKLGVFEPVTVLPKGKIAIPCRWVFKVKRNAKNEIVKYKGRIVCQGFRQIEGIDFTETFAPTVKHKSIKLLLQLAAMCDYEIKQLDYNTAFLNAKLTEEIYVTIPEGYHKYVPTNTKYLRLIKTLYGLKQAPREWWLELNQFLNSLGYTASALDECLYVKWINGQPIYLTVYVDDTLAIYPKSNESIWLADKQAIQAKYGIKDLGDCEWILNMEVIRDRANKTITLSQASYIEEVLNRFNSSTLKPAQMPFSSTRDITAYSEFNDSPALKEAEIKLYQQIIGSLNYASIITRIDISYITNLLARYCSAPTQLHLQAAMHVLRYLIKQKDLKLVFKSNGNQQCTITLYTDSDWAGEAVDRKSVGGWIAMFNDCPVAWESKKQPTVAKSATEAEYYALCEAVSESLFLKQWFEEYIKHLNQPAITIKCDNTGAIKMSDHSTNHRRTKHIDVKHFFCRDAIKLNGMKVIHIPTHKNLADILTKPVKSIIFKTLKDQLLVK
jgi:hypothetical protein